MTDAEAIAILRKLVTAFGLSREFCDPDFLTKDGIGKLNEVDAESVRMFVGKLQRFCDEHSVSAEQVRLRLARMCNTSRSKYKPAIAEFWTMVGELATYRDAGASPVRRDDRDEPFDPLAGKPWPVVRRELESLEAEMTRKRQPNLANRVRRQIQKLESEYGAA